MGDSDHLVLKKLVVLKLSLLNQTSPVTGIQPFIYNIEVNNHLASNSHTNGCIPVTGDV